MSDAKTAASPFLGTSQKAQRVRDWIDHAARVDASVLILGESGVGKELVARAIHERSSRSSHPYFPVNCAAIPETLIESELFGHEAGAFTDARTVRRGAFELAHRGTLFLDEVGDLSTSAQPKLLRSLETREFYPVGSERPRAVDLRVIAATNHDLMTMTLAGTFRSDLYFRLRVLEIRIPPLRERPDDIPEIACRLIDALVPASHGARPAIHPRTMRQLQGYPWPGNVRELRAVLERAIALNGAEGTLDDAHFELTAPAPPSSSLDELLDREWKAARVRFEAAYASHLLARSGGDVMRAAAASGLAPRSIYKMLHRQGLRPRQLDH